jgi:hypothetical protein
MCCIALVRRVLVIRCGSAGWCGILMQAEALLQPGLSLFKYEDVISIVTHGDCYESCDYSEC